ncbi:MAG: pyrroline-5-carboxylate reductase [Lachnospiraceae bacterium]|nr:pyrroline-5-carboxylate reductase [Lachnospiraceae bacterium]
MKIGFIGLGNMASAMIGGLIDKEVVSAGDIEGYDTLLSVRRDAEEQFGIVISGSNLEVVRHSEIIVLAVKPQFYPDVISEIRFAGGEGKLFISIAPGKTLSWLRDCFEEDVKLVRCMPNTPALVGEGMTGVCPNDRVTDEEFENVMEVIKSFGRARLVPERLMDAVVAVSGSSPAYVFMMIEAMADAAVAEGLPRQDAYQFAAQAVYGSAKMVLETGKHPGELKDMVCSPAGTTIEAVQVLERTGFRSSLMEAMRACAEKSREL